MQSAILQSSAQIDSFYPMFMRMLLSVFVLFQQILLYYSVCSIEGKKLGRQA